MTYYSPSLANVAPLRIPGTTSRIVNVTKAQHVGKFWATATSVSINLKSLPKSAWKSPNCFEIISLVLYENGFPNHEQIAGIYADISDIPQRDGAVEIGVYCDGNVRTDPCVYRKGRLDLTAHVRRFEDKIWARLQGAAKHDTLYLQYVVDR